MNPPATGEAATENPETANLPASGKPAADQQEGGKSRVRQQFTPNAADYRDSPLFAEGSDLAVMVDAAALNGTERVLDLGTGAGHTALAFAAKSASCVGLDLTEAMVRVARGLAAERGAANVEFQVGDAEDIPYGNASFDVAVCRFAAHHFADPGRAMTEIVRILKPGGKFILADHIAPEDGELDAFVNRLDKIRDPSHVREYRLSEWREWFMRHGLNVRIAAEWALPLNVADWVARARTPEAAKEALHRHFRSASPACRKAFQVSFDAADMPIAFSLHCAVVCGTKTR